MKDLLSKEHYFPKIHTLLMEKSHYRLPPPSIENPALYGLHPIFTKKILTPLLWFFKNLNFPLNKGGSHYDASVQHVSAKV